jgi:carbamoyl-phosphate synthase large subunit
MTPRSLCIAVTGLNALDNPGPGIPVIRSLRESKRFNCRIIGLSYDHLEPGIYMHNLVDKTYQLPLPSEGTAALLKRLAYIQEKEHIDVLIPNFDSELYNFIKLVPELKQIGIHTFLPDAAQFESRQKINLSDFGQHTKVLVPEAHVIYKAADLNYLPNNFNYPLLVKGKFYDAGIAYTQQQAVQYFQTIAAKWGTPIIIQQFQAGQEVNVTALGDGKGGLLGMVAMRKQYITEKGKAWSGISIQDEALTDMAEKIMKGSHWRGPLELEIIKNEKGEYYLIEINPRFPAWIYLATGCGQNHPEALLQLALGETPSSFDNYVVGKLFIRYSYDMIIDLKEFETIATLGEL